MCTPKIAIAAALVACAGCQHTSGGNTSNPAAPTMSLTQLKDSITGRTGDSAETISGRNVTVRGRVALKYRGQQYLWVEEAKRTEDPTDHCLQLVIPDAVLRSIRGSPKMLTLTGRLLVMRQSEGLYTNYVVDGVSVYPYCTLAPYVYLRVDSAN